jgi:hypothetical protein
MPVNRSAIEVCQLVHNGDFLGQSGHVRMQRGTKAIGLTKSISPVPLKSRSGIRSIEQHPVNPVSIRCNPFISNIQKKLHPFSINLTAQQMNDSPFELHPLG